jgi:hypothetical protein
MVSEIGMLQVNMRESCVVFMRIYLSCSLIGDEISVKFTDSIRHFLMNFRFENILGFPL